jgi:hypothetical protein
MGNQRPSRSHLWRDEAGVLPARRKAKWLALQRDLVDLSVAVSAASQHQMMHQPQGCARRFDRSQLETALLSCVAEVIAVEMAALSGPKTAWKGGCAQYPAKLLVHTVLAAGRSMGTPNSPKSHSMGCPSALLDR